MNKKIATFGEIMMRLSTSAGERITQANGFHAHYGGGEANVAVSLATMALDTKFISALPLNPIGEACTQNLRRYNVDTSGIHYSQNRMGVYYLETGVGQRGSQVIYDRADSAFASLKPGTMDWDEVLKEVTWFHWSGISPAVSQSAADVTKEAVFAAARNKNITISVDLNFRDKLWKYGKKPVEIMPELVSKCHVMVGNEGHNKYMLDIEPVNGLGKTAKEDIQEACRRVTEKYPSVHTVGLSLRENLSASNNLLSGALYREGNIYHTTQYNINPIVDRIGGGDAFMAGLVYGLNEMPSDPQEIINYAVGASVLKHTISGDFNLVTAEEVKQFIKTNGSGHVAR